MADFLQPLLPPQRPGDSAGAPQHPDYLDNPPSSWKVYGSNIKQKIRPGDTLWVVRPLDSNAAEGSSQAAWALVARIEVEKARYVPYKAQLIRPGPGSRWFPPADLTAVIAKLHRFLDERDETGLSPKAEPPAPAPAPAAPWTQPTPDELKEWLHRLREDAPPLAAPPPRPPQPPLEGSPGRIPRFSGFKPHVAAPKPPPAVPTSGMVNSLRYSLKFNYPYLSCLVDAAPLRQWAEQLVIGKDGGG